MLPLGGVVERREGAGFVEVDDAGVAVRAGDMAAIPLLKRFGVTEAVRASCYLYTTTAEVDRLIDGLRILAR